MTRKKMFWIFGACLLFCGLVFLGSSRGLMPSIIEAIRSRQEESRHRVQTQLKVVEALGTDCFSKAKNEGERKICEQAEEAMADAANLHWRDCGDDVVRFRCPFTLVGNQVTAERVRRSLQAKDAKVSLMDIVDSENGLNGSFTKLTDSNLNAKEVLDGQMKALNADQSFELTEIQIKGATQAYKAILRGTAGGQAALYGLTFVRGRDVYTILIKDSYNALEVPNFERLRASLTIAPER